MKKSKKGNEDEYKKSSNEGVLESSDENGERDEEELPQNLNTRPRQYSAQCDRQYVLWIWIQQIPPIHTQYHSFILQFLLSSIFWPFLFFSAVLSLSIPLICFHRQFSRNTTVTVDWVWCFFKGKHWAGWWIVSNRKWNRRLEEGSCKP